MGSGHMYHRGSSALDDHFDHSNVVFKNVQLRLTLRRVCVCDDGPHATIDQRLGFSLVCVRSISGSHRQLRTCFFFFGDLVLFDERDTVNNPSILSQASNETESDSFVVWDTDVCF